MANLNCISCDKELLNIGDEFDGGGHQPCGGLSFHTYGHYGSTFFDPMDGSAIQIAICDECLVKADDKGRIDRPKGKNPDFSWDEIDKECRELLESDDWTIVEERKL